MITAGVLSKVLSPVYEAKAVFFVPKEPDTTTFFAPPGVEIARSPLIPEGKEEIQGPYIGILKSKTIAEMVQKEFPHKSVIDLIRRDMDFVLSDEYMIEVYARDRDSGMAAGIANAYVNYFKQLMDEYSLKSQSERQLTIEKELAINQKNLLVAKETLNIFQQKNRTANLDEEIKQLISMKILFESQLETSLISYNENKKKTLTTKRKIKEEAHAFNTSELIINSPLLEKLREQLVDIEAKMASLRVEIKDAHPDYMTLKENYEEVKKNIDQEMEIIIKSQIKTPDTFYENLRRQLINLYVDREGIKATIEGNKKALKKLEERIIEIPTLNTQLDTLTTEVDKYKRLVDTLIVNLAEVKSQAKRAPQVAVLVEKATPPPRPAFPILWLNMIIAGIVGILGGIFYCFFVNYLDETREKRIFRLWKVIKSIEG